MSLIRSYGTTFGSMLPCLVGKNEVQHNRISHRTISWLLEFTSLPLPNIRCSPTEVFPLYCSPSSDGGSDFVTLSLNICKIQSVNGNVDLLLVHSMNSCKPEHVSERGWWPNREQGPVCLAYHFTSLGSQVHIGCHGSKLLVLGCFVLQIIHGTWGHSLLNRHRQTLSSLVF